ncbi:hypothetical protein Acr_06g0013960 [Actinidia rufa]|uniref:HVA22-like protein n=1 Tax=Actinidia rufa TaxID=165716 RepID=A0A7J0ET99_9ERIC|nr:hypothetical protein Acr_06g0013960 [Actinidia rufa]
MKLLAICWLVVPHFNGACYVYECLLRPCLSVNPRVVIKYLIKPKENPSLSAESFLAVAERYVKENGSEALEKLIDSKSKHTKPNTDVEEMKASNEYGEEGNGCSNPVVKNALKPKAQQSAQVALQNVESPASVHEALPKCKKRGASQEAQGAALFALHQRKAVISSNI